MQFLAQQSTVQARLLALIAAAPESRFAERFVEFIGAEPGCLERTTVGGHLTASALVVDSARRHTLLIHHRQLGRWLQPGGHADGDEDLPAVALREAVEETGLASCRLVDRRPIDLDIHHIPQHRGVLAHHHFDVRFAVEADRDEALAPSLVEVHAARWFSAAEIARLPGVATDESVRRLVRVVLR